MKRTLVLAALASMGLPGVVGGCSPDSDPQTGTLELALMANGSSGTAYGLAATFLLNDPENLQIASSELDQQMSLSLSPRVGNWDLTMCANGIDVCTGIAPWRLYELSCADGSAEPAEICIQDPTIGVVGTAVPTATLLSSNPQAVSIQANQTTTAVFQFVVPGEGTVVFARGGLNIQAEVQEGLSDGAACTQAIECLSHVCADDGTGAPVCQVATCTDGVLNGGEAGPDCGGPCSTPCPGQGTGTCLVSSDCQPGELCVGADPANLLEGVCAPGSGGPCLDDGECPTGELCEGADPANLLEGVCTPL